MQQNHSLYRVGGFCAWTCLWFLGVVLCWSPMAQAAEFYVDYKADRVEYVAPTGVFRLLGNVKLTVKEIEASSPRNKNCIKIEKKSPEIGDEATMKGAKTAFSNKCVVRQFEIQTERLDYDRKRKLLETPVRFELEQIPIQQDEKKRTLTGATLKYDFGLRRIEAKDVYLVMEAQMPGHEIYVQGDLMTAYNDGQRVVFTNGFYTTCNHIETTDAIEGEDPYSREAVQRRTTHYAIDAEILDFVQGERLLAWNADILTFEKQAFWFPFWYIPLSSDSMGFQKPDIDYGQNPIEGNFLRFKSYYNWNEYHDGYVFGSVMEKTGVGLGFQHNWIAYPNSISQLYFYGIPVTTGFLDVPAALFRGASAEQSEATLTTQQIQQNGFFASVDDWLSNKFQDYHIKFEHRQKLLPHTEATIRYEDKDFYNAAAAALNATRNPIQTFDLTIDDQQKFLVDPYNTLDVTTNLKLNQTQNRTINDTFDQANNLNNKTTQSTQNQSRSATVSAKLGKSPLNTNSNWTNNSTRSLRETENLETGDVSVDENKLNSAGENWSNTLAFTTQIDEKTTLKTDLRYTSNLSGVTAERQGNLRQELIPKLNLTQNHSWGTVLVSYEDFFDLSLEQRNNSQVKKLPELKFNFQPVFKEYFPISLETTIGRYFEQAAFIQTESLNEISRGQFKLSVGSKEHDLGLGMKVNYNGTSLEQRFYQTLDAEYIFTGQVNLKNDLSPYFVPSLTYSRAIQDLENNNSPFTSFEPLALRRQNNLRANIGIVNLPEFTFTLSGGYDYLNRTYQQFQASIRSQIASQFTMNAQTGYQPITIRDTDVGLPLKDISGNEYVHPDSRVTSPLIVTEDMVGSLSGLGGRWSNTTLSFRWRNVPYDLNIGNLNTFGLEEGVPNGFELGAGVAWDPHQGRFNSLNGLARFKIGEDWRWHTEIDFEVAVQPFSVTEQASTDFGAFFGTLQFPVKVTLRKDLHDFVLTASWDSFYQQFNLNLALLAFPYDTGDLLGNVSSLNNQLNAAGNQVNQQR